MENTHERHRECGMVYHHICGSEQYVAAEVERVQRDYPAAGYGTRLSLLTQDANGHTTACVTRSASCD